MNHSSIQKALAGLLTFSFVFAFAGTPALAADSAKDILKKSTNALQVKTEISTYKMSITRNGETKDRVMDVWFHRESDDQAKFLLKIKEPANLRGTGLLTIKEKDEKAKQWLYLPAYRKTRRIQKGSEEEPFLGSDFSIGDLSIEQADLYEFKLDGETDCDGGRCHVLVGEPKEGKDGKGAFYSKKKLLVRTDNFINVRGEFYDSEGKLNKVMTAQGLKKDAAGQWDVTSLRMEDVKRKSVTVIEFVKRDRGKVPPASVFDVRFMEK